MSSATKSMMSTNNPNDDDEHDGDVRRGPWTIEEDTFLIHYIARHGEGRWNSLAKRAGLRRTGKSCRLRWLNYLKPDVKRGNLSPQEQLLILDLHSKWGNKWSKIAQQLPGRTDNEIKNYWRTRVQKQAKHLKLDANSKAFQDIVRCFWVPRLLQKIEGSSSSSSSSMLSQLDATNFAPAWPPPLPLPPHNQVPLNSDSEHCTSSCISSADSVNISQVSQIISDFDAVGNNMISCEPSSNLMKGSCYDMEILNMATMASGPEGFGNPVGDCDVADGSWLGYDIGDAMWNMDEFWLSRSLQEREAQGYSYF